jgi:sterol desaturase/sphingolipid hydroxylase (fatty acid hydroxylase superfamily)
VDAATLTRFGVFAGGLVLLAILEALFEAHHRRRGRRARWSVNLTLGLLGAVLVRLMGPLSAAALTLWAESRGIGLMASSSLPPLAVWAVSLLALDLAVWAQHVVFHRVPLLWRLHAVHHADPDVDVTTALRFHPVELLISQAWKAAVAVLLGVPAEALLVFEAALNLSAMFNHANLYLPPRGDALLRAVVVTPAMHRIHHAPERALHDTNFGFCLSVWDRVFGTWTNAAARPDTGLSDWTPAEAESVPSVLLRPVTGPS